MEGDFRNILIIISAIVIGAIFIHGLWTIRKNKNPYKLKTKSDSVEPLERGFDNSGFDQDGVSRARVVETAAEKRSKQPELSEEETPEAAAPAPEYAEEPIPTDFKSQDAVPFDLEEDTVPPIKIDTDALNESNTHIDIEIAEPQIQESIAEVVEEPPVYQEPVIQAKPKAEVKPVRKRASRASSKDALKRNQMGFDFDDDVENDMPSMSAIDEPKAEEKPSLTPEVIVLSVVMPENQFISGAALLPTLLTLGMKYGEMNIFHRHQDNAGNGKVTFSLANMVNPGTFDLDSMESFATQGVSLFMTLPNAGNPFEVFDQMLNAAKQLAQEFNGQLLDDKRSVMTKQTEQHYIGKIREFDRKSRIASA